MNVVFDEINKEEMQKYYYKTIKTRDKTFLAKCTVPKYDIPNEETKKQIYNFINTVGYITARSIASAFRINPLGVHGLLSQIDGIKHKILEGKNAYYIG